MLFGEVAHKILLDLQAARIPPRQPYQKCVRARAPCQASGFRIEEKPFFWVFQCGARLARNGFVARAGKQFECCGCWVRKFRSGEPVSNGEVLAKMIRGDARAEEPAERIFFAGRSNRRRPRRHWPCGLQRGESRELIGSGGHLGTQPVENSEGGIFCARGKIACGTHAGRAALFAGTRGDEFVGFLHQESVRSKEGCGKADAAGISVVQVQVWLEEFFGVGGKGVLQASWREVYFERMRGQTR